jgi:hypothetical protein
LSRTLLEKKKEEKNREKERERETDTGEILVTAGR